MWQFAQTNLYGYPTTVTVTHTTNWGGYLFFWLVFFVIFVVAYWKIFTKAGEAGWKSIIPIWNAIVVLRIIGLSPWYILLFLIPFVNFLFSIYVAYKVAVAFGYGVGMTILEFIFGIGLLIIAYGDSKYLGPDGKPSAHVQQA